ncbi:hypothetical protein [Variovorax sp. KBW07]|uniref:hypothetical protein n=1 Tax=Variovorax sp. KBW07 TaxID=2153358 RepID=UPI001627DF78|nr:hypothetical protein [Variovorax sp. KBW07]
MHQNAAGVPRRHRRPAAADASEGPENLLVGLVDHPEDTALIEQTIADIERFFTSPS